MSLKTTMYIHDTTMRLINNACALTGKKRNTMIVRLLLNVMADPVREIKTGCLVRYQECDRKENWHTVPVLFREDEADYFKDLRNFLKQSVSLILAQAARAYLEDIIRKSRRGEKNYNYPFVNYILSREEVDGLVFWKICWGFPPKPQKYFRRVP